MSVYDFKVKKNNGTEVSLSDYRGKVLLIVNTASKCGFTPQYKELEELYLKHKAEGFEILAFPSNDFAGQEPGTDAEISEFCSLNYGVTFPLFSKIPVKGDGAHPLFAYLVGQKKFKGFDPAHPIAAKLTEILGQALSGDSIKWNFTKFLVDRSGNVVDRFEPTTVPTAIEKDIASLLAAKA